MRALAAVLVAGCAARATPPPLAPAVRHLAAEFDSAFAAPEYARAAWGVVVQSLESGEVLYRRNAERLFMPASNQKILTGSVALARLGADFRWRTPVLARGSVRGDTLAGDLVVVGRGDPTLSVQAMRGADLLAPLRPWADSLRARGIRVVAGRIVGDASWFPDPPLGVGWSWDDLQEGYAAPVGALLLNEGVAVLEVAPGPAGQPALVAILPRTAPLRIHADVRTVPAESVPAPRVRWTRSPFSDSVTVSGAIAAGARPRHDTVSVGDPTRYFEAALGQVLEEAGIRVMGATAPAAPALDTLFVWQSLPLRDVLPYFEKPSQNQIGEMLLRTLGSLRGVASQDSGRAVVRETLAGWGVPADAIVYVDGSGLSRYNYVAPDAVARVLVAMARRPDFQIFLDALPVAGVDGTLAGRMRGTAAQGNARAKTGTIANTRNISGYVTTRDGEHLVFVLLANHFTVPSSVPTAVQDRLVERLANFSRDPR